MINPYDNENNGNKKICISEIQHIKKKNAYQLNEMVDGQRAITAWACPILNGQSRDTPTQQET